MAAKKMKNVVRFCLPALGLAFLFAATASAQSAWEEQILRDPSVLEDETIGPLERKVLSVVTPEQARLFSEGTDPSQIVLESGETLADFIGRTIAGGPGLVYEPVDQCLLFSTYAQQLPVAVRRMEADEIREFVARGSGTEHTDQGGIADCLIPTEAVAVVMHFRLVTRQVSGVNGFLKAWPADDPEPATRILDYQPLVEPGLKIVRFNTSAVLELCPAGSCMGGEFKVKTGELAAHVRGDVAGFFRPIETADVPAGAGSGLSADTLDGLDSGQFLRSDASDNLTAGTLTTDAGTTLKVAGALDTTMATSLGLPATGITGAGSGSGLDADLLDGKDSLDLGLQVSNCLTVSPSCPVVAADALAARCWQTISAALATVDPACVSGCLPAATSLNKYVVKVGPGTYSEQVTMQSFVDIEGSGEKLTMITNAASPTLAGTDNAELRHLTVENTGGATAIQNSGVSPMIKHVTARATGAATAKGVENGMGAGPMLTHVTTQSDGDGVESSGASSVTVRDSILNGAVNGIENATSTASVVNTQISGGAADGATGATFTCLGAYDATFTELDANCQ